MNSETAMWLAIGLTTLAGSGMLTALFLGPIGRAIGARISGGRGGAAAGVSQEVERTAGQVHALQDRLAELEERLDFAERLLARSPEREALPKR